MTLDLNVPLSFYVMLPFLLLHLLTVLQTARYFVSFKWSTYACLKGPAFINGNNLSETRFLLVNVD